MNYESAIQEIDRRCRMQGERTASQTGPEISADKREKIKWEVACACHLNYLRDAYREIANRDAMIEQLSIRLERANQELDQIYEQHPGLEPCNESFQMEAIE